MITIYFVINTIEAFALAAYLAMVGSDPGASVIFNLSWARLLLVAAMAVMGLFFAYLAVKSRMPKSRVRQRLETHLKKERSVWLVFIAGLALTALMLILLTRQTNQFGDYKLIYQRFEPVIVWLAAVGVQTAFFEALWYCAYFIDYGREVKFKEAMAELLPLTGFYLLFVLLKLLLVTSTSYGPLGRGDEMTYFDMAESLYRGFFSVADSHHYPPLYPLSFMPAMVFKGYAFEGIKLLNVIYSSSIIFPIYFIARKFLDRKHSLIAVVLTCLIPYHLVFPRRILSENLFFPFFLWTVFITFVLPRSRRSRLMWDILNGCMLAVIYLTRYISLVAIPFFMLSWWVKPFEGEGSLFKPGWKKIRHAFLLVLAMLLVFSPRIISGLSEEVPLKLLLGFSVASKTDPAQLTFGHLMIWVVLYACYYVLVSAPVLNLLLASFSQIDYKRWRRGLGRLLFQVLALMAGFYIAVVRHSWRAYYNREIPSKIMGRYLIVYSVLYIVIALVVLLKFDRKRIKSSFRFVLFTVVIPFALVIFAHYTLIQGVVIPTDGNLLKALGSVDGFLTEILGPYFFIMVAVLYALETYLLLNEKRKYLLPVIVSGLLLYYLSGIPAYYQDLMEYQTYPWLAKQVAGLLPAPDLKDPTMEKITVYLPPDHVSKDKAEIYNSLRVRGIDGTEVLTYAKDDLENMPTEKGFIIQKLADEDIPLDDPSVVEFNGEYFTITRVDS
jgi:hypothetical protein